MFFFNKDPLNKAKKLLAQGKIDKALENFKIILAQDPENLEVLQLCIDALAQKKSEWDEDDFTLSLDCTMKLQELENPNIKLVHQQLSSEFKDIYQIIERMFVSEDAELINRFKNQLIEKGPASILPLIEFLLSLKKVGSELS